MSDTAVGTAVEYWLDTVSKNYALNCCIAASTIVSDALSFFGVECEPMAVDIIAYNKAGREASDAGLPISEWPDEAWSVGSDHDRPVGGPGYDGHLVVYFPGKGFVDLTCNQYRKPDKGIAVEAPIWVELPDDYEMGKWLELPRPDGTKVVYRLRPDQKRWKHAKDYRSPYRKRFAGEMIRHIRGVMAASAAPYYEEAPLG